MNAGHNDSRLKPDHTLPMALMRKCPTCSRGSVFVNGIGDFAYRCINPACPIRHYLEYIPCMLQHRNFQTYNMNIRLGETLWVKQDGAVDFEHPEMQPDWDESPHENCDGVLVWDTRGEGGAEWLKCNRCEAIYRTYIFSRYGLAGPEILHKDYRLVERRRGEPPSIVQNLVSSTGFDKPVPSQWAFAIDKVRYQGEDIIYYILNLNP